jgi:hypothetical protein
MNKITIIILFGLLTFSIQFMSASVEKFAITQRTTDSVVWQGQHQGKTTTITKKQTQYKQMHNVFVTIPGEDTLVGYYATNGMIVAAAYENRKQENRIAYQDTPTTLLFKNLIKKYDINLQEPYKQN